MTGKYTPPEHYLHDLPASQKDVSLSFEQIERILNDKLPPSAYQYQESWSYEKHPHNPEKQAVLDAGWKVETIDLMGKLIRFIRMK